MSLKSNTMKVSPQAGICLDISYSARNAGSLERRLAVGFTLEKTLNAD
jgi:hypothetical protein